MKATSAGSAAVALGSDLSGVCVVRLWPTARLGPSWELPPHPSLHVELLYIMSTRRTPPLPSPVPPVSLVIMKIVLQPVHAGVGRRNGPLCGGGVFKRLCFTDREGAGGWGGTSDCSQVTAADPRWARWSRPEAAQLRCSESQTNPSPVRTEERPLPLISGFRSSGSGEELSAAAIFISSESAGDQPHPHLSVLLFPWSHLLGPGGGGRHSRSRI